MGTNHHLTVMMRPRAKGKAEKNWGWKPSDRIRLPYESLPPEWAQWAHTEMGWNDQATNDVWAYFRDYWRGRTGVEARKIRLGSNMARLVPQAKHSFRRAEGG